MRKSVIAAAGALLLAAEASSGSNADAGFLDTIIVWTGGQVMVSTSGTRTSVPSCGSSRPRQFAFNSTTAAGKAQLSRRLAGSESLIADSVEIRSTEQSVGRSRANRAVPAGRTSRFHERSRRSE